MTIKNEKLNNWINQFLQDAEKPFSKEWYIAYGKVIFGCFIFALVDFLMVVPYGMAPGGVYGLMSVFNNLWGWPMDIVIFMDLPLFILGLVVLGGNLGIKTLVSVIFTWLFTFLTENVFYIPQYGYIPLIHSGEFISVDTFTALSA
ncbi:MAG: YitT family protein, partial [Bacteroidales bacterium]|nr:YitT family protein [Bacteroidales bacterium]